MRTMNNSQKTITSALEELGAELGVSEADFGGKLKIEGKDPVVASKHHIGESTSVLLALFGMELAAIWKQRTGNSQDVKVNVHNAVCNLAAVLYAKHNGVTITLADIGMLETMDYFRCNDGRWVFMPLSAAPSPVGVCGAGLPGDEGRFADRCMRWNAAELEEAMSAVGACCAMVRTREWCASGARKDHDCGAADSIEDRRQRSIPFTDDRDLPLSGTECSITRRSTLVRFVPVMRRMRGRCAAPAFADDAQPAAVGQRSDAERSAWCDLTNPSMRDQFWELVKDADVWANSRLTRQQSISPQQLAAVKPESFGRATLLRIQWPLGRVWWVRAAWARVTGFSVNEFRLADQPADLFAQRRDGGVEAAIGMLRPCVVCARAQSGRVPLAGTVPGCRTSGFFRNEVRGAGLPESMMTDWVAGQNST